MAVGEVGGRRPPPPAVGRGDTVCGLAVPRIGLLWMAVSAWGYATASLFARMASHGATSWQIVFVRCFLQWALATTYHHAYHPAVELWGNGATQRFLALRGCVGIGGLSCFYYSATHMPLSDATVVMFTAPVWTCLIAWLLLNEKMGAGETASILISVVGICCIARPSFLFGPSMTPPASQGDGGAAAPAVGTGGADAEEGGQTFALVVGVLGSIFAACAYTVIRFVGGDVHFIAQVHAFAVAGMVVAPVAVMVCEGRPLLSDSSVWHWEVLCGITGFMAQCFMSRGLQLEKAGPASLMRNVDVLFAFGYQAVFIDPGAITFLSLVGAGCILGSATVITLSKAPKTPTSPAPDDIVGGTASRGAAAGAVGLPLHKS